MEPSQTLSWPVLRKHLDSLRDRARNQMEESEGIELNRIQGELRLLRKLENLPETLALLDAEDRRVADEKKGR
jgi:hypothetical protein